MLYRKEHRRQGAANATTQDAPEWLRSGDGSDGGADAGVADDASARDAAAHAKFLVIIHGESGPQLVWCESAADACASLETQIGEGKERESIELIRATKLPFDVSFRPVVDLEVS